MNIGMASSEQGGEKKTGNGFDAKSSLEALSKLREGSEGRSRRELAAFYRDAARKRSPEYMKNLERLSQLRAKRNRLVSGEETAGKGTSETNNEVETSDDAALSDLSEIDKEIEDVGKALEKEMPQGSVLLTLIFWDMYQNILVQQGIIAPGDYETFTDAEDLIRKCGVENNEKAKEQLRRGNSEFRSVGPACMAVEIYLDAICVIYPDGAVKVLRGDPELGV
jgi:hypothetical protein